MNPLRVGMEFTDGHFSYLVLKASTVDWSMVLYGREVDPCCAHHESEVPCTGEPYWVVIDNEGCTYNLCEKAETDCEFFNPFIGDMLDDPVHGKQADFHPMEEVDPHLSGLRHINKWRLYSRTVTIPIRSPKRLLDWHDVMGGHVNA